MGRVAVRGALATHLGHRPGTCGKQGSAGGAEGPRARESGKGGRAEGDPAAAVRPSLPRPAPDRLTRASCAPLSRAARITALGLPCTTAASAPAQGQLGSTAVAPRPSLSLAPFSHFGASARRWPASFCLLSL